MPHFPHFTLVNGEDSVLWGTLSHNWLVLAPHYLIIFACFIMFELASFGDYFIMLSESFPLVSLICRHSHIHVLLDLLGVIIYEKCWYCSRLGVSCQFNIGLAVISSFDNPTNFWPIKFVVHFVSANYLFSSFSPIWTLSFLIAWIFCVLNRWTRKSAFVGFPPV